MRTISLKLPDELDARLEARAQHLGRSKSDVTREALTRLLDEGPSRRGSSLDLVGDLVGSVSGPGDLSVNKKHMRKYGR
jgi:Arc/MetJ-type ribon-helix-helix transcriptional regulator